MPVPAAGTADPGRAAPAPVSQRKANMSKSVAVKEAAAVGAGGCEIRTWIPETYDRYAGRPAHALGKHCARATQAGAGRDGTREGRGSKRH